MDELVSFPLEGGESVLVEVDLPPGVVKVAPRERVSREAQHTFESALAGVKRAASTALDQFQRMAPQPDEVKITFGVRLDAEAGAVIAKTGVQGQFEVSVAWQRRP